MKPSKGLSLAYFHLFEEEKNRWNSWDHFGCNINEHMIRQTSCAVLRNLIIVWFTVDSGLGKLGYQYINIGS
jgi:hypothetical protein